MSNSITLEVIVLKLLETERLILRDWQPDDLDDLYEYSKNPNFGILTGWKPHESKKESAEVLNYFISDKINDRFAIVLKDDGKVIGAINLSPDENRGKYYAKYINYVLNVDYWGCGYMTEAVKRIIQYAFEELKIDLLSVFHYPHNVRSKCVIERCGFEYELTVKQGGKIYDGQAFDTVCYLLLKDKYFSNQEY